MKRMFLALSAAFISCFCFVDPGRVTTLEENVEKLRGAVEDYNREVNRLNQLPEDVSLSLTFPAGKSPKVFTHGWVFGAQCIVNPGTKDQVDISENIRWKGTGTFTPDRGPLSRPVFNTTGTNQIVLYFEEDGKVVFEKRFNVEAIDPKGYARVGDKSYCPADAHACPTCPHTVTGPIVSGSPNVTIGGMGAARVGDNGVHAACCGPNQYVITSGDPNVLIDGRPAVRLGDQTQHCGGYGKISTAFGKGS